MDKVPMIIMWNGKWNDDKYVGGDKRCLMANKNATFSQLVDIIYMRTKIDKTRYDINIHFLTEPSGNLLAIKIPIKNDCGVEFVMYDKCRYKVIFVDMICKDAGVCNLHSELQYQFSSYSGGNQDRGVAVPLTSARSPLWNDNFGIYGTTDLLDNASNTGISREGRIPFAGEARGRKKCRKYDAQGHNRFGCPNKWSSSIGESSTTATQKSRDIVVATARVSQKCNICKETGHTRRRCPVQLCNPGDDNLGNDVDNQ